MFHNFFSSGFRKARTQTSFSTGPEDFWRLEMAVLHLSYVRRSECVKKEGGGGSFNVSMSISRPFLILRSSPLMELHTHFRKDPQRNLCHYFRPVSSLIEINLVIFPADRKTQMVSQTSNCVSSSLQPFCRFII